MASTLNQIASFLVHQMLSYSRISVEILKDQFHLDDLQFRKVLIQLYFTNRVFGSIFTSEETGKKYLVFTPSTRHPSQISLEHIIDWNLSMFDLSTLQAGALASPSKLTAEPKPLSFSVNSDQELFSTSETHQKDLISSEMTVGINTYTITASVILRNNSEASIRDVKFRLNFPPALIFINTIPTCIMERTTQSLSIELGEIGASQARRYVINFLPTKEHTPFLFDGIIQYKSVEGFARIIRLEAITITLDVPLIKNYNGTPAMISTMMDSPKIVKLLQGVGCPELDDMTQAHIYLEMVTQSLGFKRVEGMDSLPPHTSFFLGTSMNHLGKPYLILISPQVSNRILQFYVCCPYEMIGYSVLWKLSMKLQDKLRLEGLCPRNQYLIRMNCTVCNHLLEIFPPAGDPVACKYCQTLQIPWSLANGK